MIPTIGLMMGVYIITRMLELLDKKEVRATPKVFAVITIIITIFCIFALLASGASTKQL